KILPKNRIPEEQWNAAMDLIYDRRREGFDPLTHFISLFPDDASGSAKPQVAAGAYDDLAVEEKLKRHIIDGEKRNLTDHLDLAPVRGDVHDIGKNLVDIILTNNGYTVYNLGIKQPIHDILCACQKHQAQAIGMSGLLVKSVAVMKENLEELNAQNVTVPVLLGGAALTRDYAEDDLATLYKGPLLYCKDAFDGLHMMDAISGGKAAGVVDAQRQR